ncbi:MULTISPECIES: hypothetical protein [unclassified Janthinobacterium]|uniref:hypothetical protein n=1 Tax=unclassified Janthinobacterium TaxID=2610881 RepID=UPI0012F8556E|nr:MULTISPECIES: hypothetical protein [unclassified Janthinobacterium]MEC5161529.1 hypothetical protein [Janthinobacterium sp. CG_S6]
MSHEPDVNAKLSSKSIDSMLSWRKRLGGIRGDFEKSGFCLPSMEMRYIESLRSRGEDERELEFYLDEITRESFNLPRGIWNVDARKVLPLHLRSSYIDLLQAKIDSKSLVLPVGSPIHKIIDVNYFIYSRLAIDANDRWKKYISDVKLQKKREIDKFNKKIAHFSPRCMDLTAINATRLIISIANELGVECCLVEKGENCRVVLRSMITDELYAYFEWSDPVVLRKWGALQISVMVQESDLPIWAPNQFRAWPYVASLGGMAPGIDWYAWRNEDWDSVVLGVLANIEFFKLCFPVCKNEDKI